MATLILMSVFLVPLVLAIRASSRPSPKRTLRRMVSWIGVFIVLWALLAPLVLDQIGLE